MVQEVNSAWSFRVWDYGSLPRSGFVFNVNGVPHVGYPSDAMRTRDRDLRELIKLAETMTRPGAPSLMVPPSHIYRSERSRMERLKIAVAGCGLGGAAVAALLQRKGYDVTVYEQSNQFLQIGSGIHLTPNMLLALKGLGVEGALLQQG